MSALLLWLAPMLLYLSTKKIVYIMDHRLPASVDGLASRCFLKPGEDEVLNKRLAVCQRLWDTSLKLAQLVVRYGVRSEGARFMLWNEAFECRMDPKSKSRHWLDKLVGRMEAESETLPVDSETTLLTLLCLVALGHLATNNRLTKLGATLDGVSATCSGLLRSDATVCEVVMQMMRTNNGGSCDGPWNAVLPALSSTPISSARKHVAIIKRHPEGSASFLSDMTPSMRLIFDSSLTPDEQMVFQRSVELASLVSEPEASENLRDHARLMVEGGREMTDHAMIEALSDSQLGLLLQVPVYGAMIEVARTHKPSGGGTGMGVALWEELGSVSGVHAHSLLPRLSGPQMAALVRAATPEQGMMLLQWLSPGTLPMAGIESLAKRFDAVPDAKDIDSPVARRLREIAGGDRMRQEGADDDEYSALRAFQGIRLPMVCSDLQVGVWEKARSGVVGDFLEAWIGPAFVAYTLLDCRRDVAGKFLDAIVVSSVISPDS